MEEASGFHFFLERKYFNPQYTVGTLSYTGSDGCRHVLCDTLEPPSAHTRQGSTLRYIQFKKGQGFRAVPLGTYEVRMAESKRFGRRLPRLTGVPGFLGVLVHEGNYPRDTRGCILPGWNRRRGMVCNSRSVLAKVVELMNEAEGNGKKVALTIFEDGKKTTTTIKNNNDMNINHFTNKAIAEMRRHYKYDPETGKLYNRKTGRELKGKSSSGYLTAGFNGVTYLVHRLVWCMEYGREPLHVIDHIDRNKENNRIENLRDVTSRENCLNKNVEPNKDTGRRGISLTHSGKRFYYVTKLNKKNYFRKLADAVRFREENGLPL